MNPYQRRAHLEITCRRRRKAAMLVSYQRRNLYDAVFDCDITTLAEDDQITDNTADADWHPADDHEVPVVQRRDEWRDGDAMDTGPQADVADETDAAEMPWGGFHIGEIDDCPRLEPWSIYPQLLPWADLDPYYEKPKEPKHQHRELCVLCAWPLALKRPWRQCEFASPGVWWRDDRPAWCRCNGCLTMPTPKAGRPPMYCHDDCRHRMKLARERAQRRADGAKSWSFDADADRIADYRIQMRKRNTERIASDHYPRW